jgi:hypothetical protein
LLRDKHFSALPASVVLFRQGRPTMMLQPLHNREPILIPVPLAELRPTQITVGMREVTEKRKHWRERADRDGGEFLGRHMIPVLLGAEQRHYVIDHHHLARALQEEGVEKVHVTVVADLHRLEKSSFWVVLDNRGWCHPYDAEGRRRDFKDIPTMISDLVDDPYRSLAGELRQAGGFAKDTTPFSEFIWADFLRRRIKLKNIKADFPAALTTALELAKTADADYLPGWCGPSRRPG